MSLLGRSLGNVSAEAPLAQRGDANAQEEGEGWVGEPELAAVGVEAGSGGLRVEQEVGEVFKHALARLVGEVLRQREHGGLQRQRVSGLGANERRALSLEASAEDTNARTVAGGRRRA